MHSSTQNILLGLERQKGEKVLEDLAESWSPGLAAVLEGDRGARLHQSRRKKYSSLFVVPLSRCQTQHEGRGDGSQAGTELTGLAA